METSRVSCPEVAVLEKLDFTSAPQPLPLSEPLTFCLSFWLLALIVIAAVSLAPS